MYVHRKFININLYAGQRRIIDSTAFDIEYYNNRHSFCFHDFRIRIDLCHCPWTPSLVHVHFICPKYLQ